MGAGRKAVVALVGATLLCTVSAAVTPLRAAAAPGDPVWSATFDGPSGGRDAASAIAVDPNGERVYVAGTSRADDTVTDFATIAYDAATGEELWIARFDGNDRRDEAAAIAVAPDGGAVFVTGYSRQKRDDNDWMTVAYAADDGALLWSRRMDLGVSGHDFPRDLVAGGGHVVVTGENGDEVRTEAYDALDGDLLWSHGFTGTMGADGYDVEVANGTAYVSGFRGTHRGSNYLVLAYRISDGDRRWFATYTGPVGGVDVARDAAPSPDGTHLYVTGTSEIAPDQAETTTIALETSNGERTWTRRVRHGLAGNQELPLIVVDPRGEHVVITTTAHAAFGLGTFLTRAYDADGSKRWTAVEDAPLHTGSPRGLGIATDGTRVYVAGNGSDLGAHDFGFLTKSYRAESGLPLWSAFEPPARKRDGAAALGLDPNGDRVFVAGVLGRDAFTAAYAA